MRLYIPSSENYINDQFSAKKGVYLIKVRAKAF